MFRTVCIVSSYWLVAAGFLAVAPANSLADEPADGLTAALLSQLSPEHLISFAEMLEQDWQDRPEWGDMLLAIMKGDAMSPGGGWWRPSGKRYDWEWLRAKCDANGDDEVTLEELPGEAAARDVWFERLNRDRDGTLTAADFDWLTQQPAKPENMASSLLFKRLDTDSNGRVEASELLGFFEQSDREKLGFLTAEDILRGLDEPGEYGSGAPDMNEMLTMFFKGELGLFEPGPQLGDDAPDFTLPTHDGQRTVALSELRGQKPVVLIFGSFT